MAEVYHIHTIGDGAFIQEVLGAVASIFQHNTFPALLGIGLMIGFLVVGFRAIITQKLELQYLLISIILFFIMFDSNDTEVWIHDDLSGYSDKVDNIPTGIAMTASILSTAGVKLTEIFETAFSIPSMTGSGYLNVLELLLDTSTEGAARANSDASFRGNMEKTIINYISECTYKGIDLGLKNEEQWLNSKKPIDDMVFASGIYHTLTFLPTDGPEGQLRTCTDAHAAIKAEVDGDFRIRWSDYLRDKYGLAGDPFASGGDIDIAINQLTAGGNDAYQYMLAQLVRNLAMKAAQYNGLKYGDAMATVISTEAQAKRNVQWSAGQNMFLRIMHPIMHPIMTFMEGLVYAVTPIMVFLMMIGSYGITLALKYLYMLAWVALWKPVMAIVNLYIYMSFRGDMTDYAAVIDPDTIAGIPYLQSTVQEWLATGGMLASSVPAITLMLVYGSSMAATHLAGRMQKDDFVDESKAAPNLTNMGAVMDMKSMASYSKNMGANFADSTQLLKTVNFGDAFKSASSALHKESVSLSKENSQTVAQVLADSGATKHMLGQGWSEKDAISSGLTNTYAAIQKITNELAKGYGDSKEVQTAIQRSMSAGLKAKAGGENLNAAINGQIHNIYSLTRAQKEDLTTKIAQIVSGEEGDHAQLNEALSQDINNSGQKIEEYSISAQKQDQFVDRQTKVKQLSDETTQLSSMEGSIALGVSGRENEVANMLVQNGNYDAINQLYKSNVETLSALRNQSLNRYDKSGVLLGSRDTLSPEGLRAQQTRETAATVSAILEGMSREPQNYMNMFQKLSQIMGSGNISGMNNPVDAIKDLKKQTSDVHRNIEFSQKDQWEKVYNAGKNVEGASDNPLHTRDDYRNEHNHNKVGNQIALTENQIENIRSSINELQAAGKTIEGPGVFSGEQFGEAFVSMFKNTEDSVIALFAGINEKYFKHNQDSAAIRDEAYNNAAWGVVESQLAIDAQKLMDDYGITYNEAMYRAAVDRSAGLDQVAQGALHSIGESATRGTYNELADYYGSQLSDNQRSLLDKRNHGAAYLGKIHDLQDNLMEVVNNNKDLKNQYNNYTSDF